MKWAYLENLSTTVKTTDLPPTFRNPSTKSMAMSLQTSEGRAATGRWDASVQSCVADIWCNHEQILTLFLLCEGYRRKPATYGESFPLPHVRSHVLLLVPVAI
jgi:hypothetical protein